MKKPLPKLRSDYEAEEFVARSDLTEYDLSAMRTVRFEFQPKSERVNMRLPRPLLDAVKATAAKAGIPYQRFIRQALETAVQSRENQDRDDGGLWQPALPGRQNRKLRREKQRSYRLPPDLAAAGLFQAARTDQYDRIRHSHHAASIR